MQHIIRFTFAIFVTFLSFIDIGMKRFGNAKANVYFQRKYNYLYSTTYKKCVISNLKLPIINLKITNYET
jgi:hypothetical protein